jgi:membrane-bound serine protease (ClpP class)
LGGVLAILASFFLTLGGNLVALNILAISLVTAIIAFLIILRKLPASRLWTRLVLKDAETTKAGFVSSYDYQAFLGKTGVALSLLRPAGVVDIDGVHLDVVSEAQYIPEGTKVKVVSVHGNRIVVRPVE